jgi:hypothetical protein
VAAIRGTLQQAQGRTFGVVVGPVSAIRRVRDRDASPGSSLIESVVNDQPWIWVIWVIWGSWVIWRVRIGARH